MAEATTTYRRSAGREEAVMAATTTAVTVAPSTTPSYLDVRSPSGRLLGLIHRTAPSYWLVHYLDHPNDRPLRYRTRKAAVEAIAEAYSLAAA